MSLFWKIPLLLVALAVIAIFAAFTYPSAFAQMFVSKAGYHIESDIAYGALPRQRYDLYIPDGVKPDAPLLVFFYGGAWSTGEKGLYPFVGQSFASRGIIVAIPDYRVYPQAIFPAFMQDGAAAVTKIDGDVRSKFGAAHKLFLAGHSAGAHIAVLLSLDKSYLKAQKFDATKIAGTIGLSGPYDFLPLTEERYKKIFPENIRATSQPINFVSGKMPPLLLLTGTDDDTVRPRNTERLAQKVNDSGGSAQTEFYDGGNHFSTVLGLHENWPLRTPPVRQTMLDFIAAHAK